MEKQRAQWSSQISFILATVGSAVGLGNIWRFPYIMGQNGGAVFLLTYLFLIAVICVVPLATELIIGKIYKTDIISTFKQINKKFAFVGWIGLLTAFLIPAFYFVIGGWILNYIWIFLSNRLPENYAQYFPSFSSQPYLTCALTILFLVLTAIFPYRGVNKGIEKANNIMMPLFFFILVGLAIYALTLPGAKEGLDFMFKADFSLFNKTTVVTALGQAFFTLSIGMGAMITYGSYMKEETNILKSSYVLIACDTLIAVLCGIMIFPIVFSYGVAPATGPTLIFVSLPEIFAKLPCSSLIGVVFFALVFFAAITSGISLLEVSVDAISQKFNISRQKSTILTASGIAFLSIPATLSFGVLSDFKILGRTFFELLDYITSGVTMPLGALLICLVAGWCIPSFWKKGFGETVFGMIFNIMLKFVIPILLIYVLCAGI